MRDHIITKKQNNLVWRLVYFLWLLRLFRPERYITEHIPALIHLRSAPTILLLILAVVWLFSDRKKYKYNIFSAFILAMFVSSVFALNHTRALWAFRVVLELYFIAGITFSYVDDIAKVKKLFALYFVYIFYFALWGIPGHGRVEWDYILNEEDAFGPLMTMGVVFGYYFLRLYDKGKARLLVQTGIIICIVGVVVSFARGAFLVLLAIVFAIFLRERNKLKNLSFAIAAGIIVVLAANIIFPNNAFWTEMDTISEGTSAGTGADRKILWTVAWYEFIDHPIIGVGPYNFGIQAPNYVIKIPDRKRYIDPGTIWGRALHNGYFEILCELGIVGSIIFIMLLFDFKKSNNALKIIRIHNDSTSHYTDQMAYRNMAYAIELTMFAFLINAFFYDMIFYTWFWELLILGRLIFIRYSEERISIDTNQ
jgi:O-antigen ligase